ncbi:hypothetical protein [Granulicella mallensis]|uniref:Peptidase S9 prolyl oligopeptidase catalytic domain-containing protein n=1 Tax=Granulicella mallensis TaxID=940614 RepID=A0A7W7ZMY8_9BACT|nr:hypothetical protein [Granulicella mallensis]MBB5062683.1 hypothetical protein [Granulicella mallensis]
MFYPVKNADRGTRNVRIKRAITALSLLILLALLTALVGFYRHRAARYTPDLPVTAVALSDHASVIGVYKWRICGPFVAATEDQHYTPLTERNMLLHDYLHDIHGAETPLHIALPRTNIGISFDRDPAAEDKAPITKQEFLNQDITFPTPDIKTQLLYWGEYHVFKVVYAAAFLDSPNEQDVILLSATNSPIKIWLNDQFQTQSSPGSVGEYWYAHVGTVVHLRTGKNTLLIKMLCFPFRNDFAVWIATREGAYAFIREHGGLFDLSAQLVIPRGEPIVLAPILSIYDRGKDTLKSYSILDQRGRVVRHGPLTEPTIDTSYIPDGLYSLSLKYDALTVGELIFLGNPVTRLKEYQTQCIRGARINVPCAGLSRLATTVKDASAGFAVDKQKLLVSLIANFEWSIHRLPLYDGLTDEVPRVRLISFISKIDHTIQYYYMHVPSGVPPSRHIPLAVILPTSAPILPFFDNWITLHPASLLKYSRFADRYKMAVIEPFARGELLPSDLAEADILQSIKDAEFRIAIDKSRVYLAGECGGGRSAFLLAEDHPDMFGGISTIGAATGVDTAVRDQEASRQNVLLRLRNIAFIPTRITHGAEDYHSPVRQANVLLEKGAKVGFHPELVLLPGDSEFGYVESYRKMFEVFSISKRSHMSADTVFGKSDNGTSRNYDAAQPYDH